ncbi:oxidoreductase [Leptodontidium sp. MPI-SDFR-AT-0119]|nr:oxidoreductase [Leptodontidium sp. MPI-SDFR-AT-0119]
MPNPTNTAAWLLTPNTPLIVKPAPFTTPSPTQIVIKNAAVAINPVDHMVVTMSSILYTWLPSPTILGFDVSGVVHSIGSSTTRFKPGDRVVGLAYGMEKSRNRASESAFQEYTVLNTHMVCHIPETMRFEDAAVMPLALSTAATGLFQDDQLGLKYPSLEPKPTSTATPKPTANGKTVIIWGGSTSVGCNAIQLAVAAGYEVLTTCSPKNFTYVKTLGASLAFDYNSPTVQRDIIRAMEGRISAGALTIGNGGAEACLEILARLPRYAAGKERENRKFIAMAAYPSQEPKPTTLVLPRYVLYFMMWNVKMWVKARVKGVGYKFIWGGTLVDNGLGKFMFEDFLEGALRDGRVVPSPPSEVVGRGLENVQVGFEGLREGVSAKKLVVTLQ